MKTIRNFELKVKRVQVGEGGAPYGEAIREPADVAEIARRLIGDLWCAWSYVALRAQTRMSLQT